MKYLFMALVPFLLSVCGLESNNEGEKANVTQKTQEKRVNEENEGFTIPSSLDYAQKTVTLNGKTYQVYLADSQLKRAQGLMFIEEMPSDWGMLFDFDTSDKWAFFMKNTRIPLDIIWIDENKKIVDKKTMQPCKTETCPSHEPKSKAKWVLELNAGEFKGKIGDKVAF